MVNQVQVSIVIPVYNGIKTLPKLIRGITSQTIFKQMEIVVVDSGSTDGSIDYVAGYDFVRILHIDKSDFNHGNTRNLAVQHCVGDFVLMTVQDAWTEDITLLERMLFHFDNSNIRAVCGHQAVPHDESNNPHEWFRPQDLARFKEINCSSDDFENMSPIDQRSLCGWDNVISLYRRTSLIELPFDEMIFGEDMFWAKMALKKGWTIGYDYSCTVYHYHYSFGDYTYQRTLIAKLFILKCFDYFDNRTFGFKDYLLIIYRNFKWKSHVKWIFHNWKILYQYNKATSELLKHIRNNTIRKLESDFKLNIPIGKT